MIGNIARNNNIFTYSRVQSRARNNDNVFSEALETTDSAEDTLLASAPDKWVTEPGISFTARMSVEHLENMFSFYSERAMDPSRAVSGDSEFAELIRQRYLPYSQRFFEFVDELLGRDVEEVPQESVVPDIQDCSGKLAEDFGGIVG